MKPNYFLKDKEAFIFSISLCMIFGSCKKNAFNDVQNVPQLNRIIKDGRLEISQIEMNKLYSDFKTSNKLPKNLDIDNLIKIKGANQVKDVNKITYMMAVKELVADKLINSILNKDGEIVVENILYKVTPFGTFSCKKENAPNLYALLNKIYQKFPVTSLNLENYNFDLEEFKSNDIKPVGKQASLEVESDYMRNGITINYTFKYDLNESYESNACVPPTTKPSSDFQSLSDPAINSAEDFVINSNLNSILTSLWDDPSYSKNINTYPMKNPKGDFWKTLFVNNAYHNYFDKSHRTCVLFYNRNYGFIKTLGLKVKFQSQGRLWWNTVSTDKIVAGWNYISYSGIGTENDQTSSIPLKNSAIYLPKDNESPAYDGTLPKLKLGNNTYDLGDISLTKGKYVIDFDKILFLKTTQISNDPIYIPLISGNSMDELMNKNRYYQSDPISYIKYLMETIVIPSLSEKLKKLPNGQPLTYRIVDENGNLSEEKIETTNEKLTQLVNSFGAVVKLPSGDIDMTLPPKIFIAHNTDMIDIPLDQYNTNPLKLATLILLVLTNPESIGSRFIPYVMTEFPKSFKVKNASVYGSAYNNGNWRGIRVIK